MAARKRNRNGQRRDSTDDRDDQPAFALEGFDQQQEDADDETEGEDQLQPGAGRRLQLIPHSVDERLVFRFEFGPAILAQVYEKIQLNPPRPLVEVNTREAPYPGFYQLFRNMESKYFGRTIRPVGTRLGEHARKLRGRVPLSEMTCRYLFVEDLSLVGLSEDALIAYFHPLGLDDWGKMGFGSKATGHGRAGQTSEWHEANPPDELIAVTAGGPRTLTMRHLVRQIASGAPGVLSVPTEFVQRFDADFVSSWQGLPETTLPFIEWLALLERMINPSWRVERRPMAWYIVPAV